MMDFFFYYKIYVLSIKLKFKIFSSLLPPFPSFFYFCCWYIKGIKQCLEVFANNF